MTAQTPAIHHPLPPSTELAIRGDQDRFDKYQLAALRTRGLDNVPNPELAVFFHHCKTHGLDPFARHATMAKFAGKWTIITEIDGYRYLGHRAANRRGDIIAMPEPVYVDMDGNETRHWTRPPTDPPAMVKVTILKNGAPFTGEANYYEFGHFAKDAKGKPDYTQPVGMTVTMPANQTRKCAEVQAWRMAYQDVFADLPQELPVDLSPKPAPWHVAAVTPVKQYPAQVDVDAHWDRLGLEDAGERINLTTLLAGADFIPDTLADLPEADLRRVSAQLEACEDVAQVHALIDHGDKP